jgi:hypothetical protein
VHWGAIHDRLNMTQRVVLPSSTRAQERSQQSAAVSTDEKAALAVDQRLARAVRELAVDLATARRDSRDKQQRIDSLQAEIARLLAAASAATRDQRSPHQIPAPRFFRVQRNR